MQFVLQKISDRLLHLLFCFFSWHLHFDRILICGDIAVNKGTGNGNFINFGLFSGMIGMTISFYATHAIVFVSCPRQFLHWWYSRPILITGLIACRVVRTWCDFLFFHLYTTSFCFYLGTNHSVQARMKKHDRTMHYVWCGLNANHHLCLLMC